jgi:UDP-N-acetylmuramoyl-L-alanyl-D-glutamate--2,6-diaminopimelate ligase
VFIDDYLFFFEGVSYTKIVNMRLDQSKKYAYDSRKIMPGDGFICLPKGEAYIQSALDNGATDVIHCTRFAFANAAHDYFGHPTKRVVLIGVTGTNGKTSVSVFIQQLLERLGHQVLVIGTLNSTLTTPEAWDSLAKIKAHADAGGTHVIMEVSSHGIDQHRVHGFDFNVKCLTNITQDHLDYHKTFEAYKKTKRHFMSHYSGISIFSEQVPQVNAADIPQLQGQFHVQNVSLALAVCLKLGGDERELRLMLPHLVAPNGRFESVSAGQPFRVIVDFAHTPDALDHVLKDALLLVGGHKHRLIVVFGCGGSRDKTKRAIMGKIAETYSHKIIITADNSRNESTLDIINDIKKGIANAAAIMAMMPDRYAAISRAIQEAAPGDLVLIAGKGHETLQHAQGYSYYFNDAEMAISQIVQHRRAKYSPSWVVNAPNTSADVLFITKNYTQPLGPTAQFDRCLKAPTMAKCNDYLSKIKGDKIVVLEFNHRLCLADMLMNYYKHDALRLDYNHQESLAYNLAGLTLINQTKQPIILTMKPTGDKSLLKLLAMVAPTHVLVGDVVSETALATPKILPWFQRMAKVLSPQTQWWVHHQQTDIVDSLSVGHVWAIQSPNPVDYMLQVVKGVGGPLSHALLLKWLMAKSWVNKVTINGASRPLYVAQLTLDSVAVQQKHAYFQQHSNQLNYYGLAEHESMLADHFPIISEQYRWMAVSKADGLSPISKCINQNPNAMHVVWVSGDAHPLGDFL